MRAQNSKTIRRENEERSVKNVGNNCYKQLFAQAMLLFTCCEHHHLVLFILGLPSQSNALSTRRIQAPEMNQQEHSQELDLPF
jgi:hypothetical protein